MFRKSVIEFEDARNMYQVQGDVIKSISSARTPRQDLKTNTHNALS
jgi:hypothetical protein